MLSLRKSILLISLLTVSLAPAISASSGSVYADSTSSNIQCSDGSSAVTSTTDKNAKTLTIKCKSGSNIKYPPASGFATTSLNIDCPNQDLTTGSLAKGGGSVTFSCPKKDNKTPVYNGSTEVNNDDSGTSSGNCDGDGSTCQISDPADSSSPCTKSNCPLISKYINPLITLLTILVGLVAVGAIIFGGIQVATSAGDPQKASSGKDHIRNALIGIVAYVLLYGLLQWLVPGGVS